MFERNLSEIQFKEKICLKTNFSLEVQVQYDITKF